MSNFTFLNNEWPELFETACEAEQNVNSAPLTSFDSAQPPMNARRSLELAVKWLYANDAYLKQPYADNQAALGFDFAQPAVVARYLSGAEGNPASSPRSSPSRRSATKDMAPCGDRSNKCLF